MYLLMNECESLVALGHVKKRGEWRRSRAGQGRIGQAMKKLDFFLTPLAFHWTAVADSRFTSDSGWPAGRADVRSLGSQGILVGSLGAPA